ncbi:MAG: amylo-alpha-1,6-glucosidase [Terriglobales bacterium]
MDENSVTQHFYIAAESSPADDRTRVLKHGNTFAVFDRYGDIAALGLKEQGVFCEGTRFLSQFELQLARARPLLLSSTVTADNSLFAADLTNVDILRNGEVVIPRGTLHVLRTKFLWRKVCYEQFQVVNYGNFPVDIPFRLRFAADFADIFEVRGITRKKRGEMLEDRVDENSVVLPYQGLDGIVRRTHISCTPVPRQISVSDLYFDARLAPRTQLTFNLTIGCEILPESIATPRSYQDAWSAAKAEIGELRREPSKIHSSSDEFNRWVARSQSDVDMMIVGNPQPNYPYAGVPWFSTVFGRDGIITALECLWLNPAIARGVLDFLASTQAREVNPATEAEPGKILHEMRRGEMAALGEVPFGCYYGTVDATPLFVMLAHEYYARSGDLAFIKKIWPNLERALQWIDTFGDCDRDGFVEYSRQSEDGLVQQGWKDSNDSVFHADGTLAAGPIALCEVQGYVYAAKRGAAHLASLLGDPQRSATLEAQASALRTQFAEAFWCQEIATYAMALDGRKQPCAIRTSNPGHCLYTGIANPDHAYQVAHSLLSRDFYSGWGIRTVANGESRYNPLSYHNGSIWPHDNALIAAGLARYGFKNMAGEILSALLAVSRYVDLYRLPELFCGIERRVREGPTLYPVACAPQSWAAGAVFLLLQSCLGLSLNAGRKQIRLDGPYLPEAIPDLWIRDLRVGDACVDLFLERRADLVRLQILDKRGEVEVITT